MTMRTLIRTLSLSVTLSGLIGAGCAPPPEGTRSDDCADGKDNDRNGLVDCEDPGCRLEDICIAAAARAAQEAEKTRRATDLKPEPAMADDRPYFELNGLLVQRDTNGKDIDRPAAEAYCRGLELAEHKGWRLPTQDEAVAAVNSKKLPAEPLVMWTSTDADKKRGIIVGITTGAVNDLGLRSSGQCRARCVRDGK